jgi:hypothetical protein
MTVDHMFDNFAGDRPAPAGNDGTTIEVGHSEWKPEDLEARDYVSRAQRQVTKVNGIVPGGVGPDDGDKLG